MVGPGPGFLYYVSLTETSAIAVKVHLTSRVTGQAFRRYVSGNTGATRERAMSPTDGPPRGHEHIQ